jgi:hypothetical protein
MTDSIQPDTLISYKQRRKKMSAKKQVEDYLIEFYKKYLNINLNSISCLQKDRAKMLAENTIRNLEDNFSNSDFYIICFEESIKDMFREKYKNYHIRLNLYYRYIREEKISFDLKISHDWCHSESDDIYMFMIDYMRKEENNVLKSFNIIKKNKKQIAEYNQCIKNKENEIKKIRDEIQKLNIDIKNDSDNIDRYKNL